MVSNGEVLSGQSENFDFTPIIKYLSEKFPNVEFILTHKSNVSQKNVHYTSDIIQIPECDLNEISYLSLKCDVTIGRASGPIGFTHVKENFNNKKMLMIGISNIESESFWYIPTNGCKCLWTNNYNLEFLQKFIEKGFKTYDIN